MLTSPLASLEPFLRALSLPSSSPPSAPRKTQLTPLTVYFFFPLSQQKQQQITGNSEIAPSSTLGHSSPFLLAQFLMFLFHYGLVSDEQLYPRNVPLFCLPAECSSSLVISECLVVLPTSSSSAPPACWGRRVVEREVPCYGGTDASLAPRLPGLRPAWLSPPRPFDKLSRGRCFDLKLHNQ